MTGEDMIIEEAAKILLVSRESSFPELRRVFWIAGRCENCGAPHDTETHCGVCNKPIARRDAVDPEPSKSIQWYSVKSPEHHSEWRILVANGLVAAAEHSSPVVVTRPWAPYEKNFRKWGWTVAEVAP